MSDLISKQKAIDSILGQPPEPHYPSWYADIIRKITPEEPKRRTGRWLVKGGYLECSQCGCLAPSVECADGTLWKMSSFCPDCGANMEDQNGREEM